MVECTRVVLGPGASPTTQMESHAAGRLAGSQVTPAASRDVRGRPVASSQPRAGAKKHVILFLAANPSGTDHLALDREARSIHAELKRSGFRDRFDFVTRWAVEPLDLLREVRELKPTVVHVSGHGGVRTTGGSGAPHGRDIVVASAIAGITARSSAMNWPFTRSPVSMTSA